VGVDGMCGITPEVRELIIKARRNGKKVKDIVEMFEISRKTVWKWTKRVHHPVKLISEIVHENLVGYIERSLQMLRM
jgi:DNA invertase Pin-like site-specific DNA recombinase